jgi:hypothetical protein
MKQIVIFTLNCKQHFIRMDLNDVYRGTMSVSSRTEIVKFLSAGWGLWTMLTMFQLSNEEADEELRVIFRFMGFLS